MSESPPPMDKLNNNDSDDLFYSTMGESNIPSSKLDDIDDSDIFAPTPRKEISASLDATNEIEIDDDDGDSIKKETVAAAGLSPSSSLDQPFALLNGTPSAASINIKPTIVSSNSNANITQIIAPSPAAPIVQKTIPLVVDEDDEDRDKFIQILISEPTKMGDGMSAYMTYKVTTKTNYPVFKKQEFSSNRRFSDFLNLYEKLKEKHLMYGRIVPPPPDKDMFGAAKIKMGSNKEESTPSDFIEKRKAHLERFVNRIAQHPILRIDPDFRDFLEISDALPKATNTSALSVASMSKFFKGVGEAVTKISVKLPTNDQWFDEKSHEIDNLSIHLKKLHSSMDTLYGWRKDLASSTKDFAKSAAVLAHAEEHISLAKALSQLGDLYEKVDELQVEQSHSDFFIITELARDYIGLLTSVREVFDQRIKVFQNWQKSEDTLKSKQDAKAKLELSNKQDKIPTALAEIKDWEGRVEKGKEEFEAISKTIKQEMKKFEIKRIREFKELLVKYLNNLLEHQQTLVKLWENYLPEVKQI